LHSRIYRILRKNKEFRKQRHLVFLAVSTAEHGLATDCPFLVALHKRNLKTELFKVTLPSKEPLLHRVIRESISILEQNQKHDIIDLIQ
jgi:hypothetical protein